MKNILSVMDLRNRFAAMKDREVMTRWLALSNIDPDQEIEGYTYAEIASLLDNEIVHRPHLWKNTKSPAQ